jgi:hypothetical protein
LRAKRGRVARWALLSWLTGEDQVLLAVTPRGRSEPCPQV